MIQTSTMRAYIVADVLRGFPPQNYGPMVVARISNQRAVFITSSAVVNRLPLRAHKEKTVILCYAGPGAFNRREALPFSPPRPHWLMLSEARPQTSLNPQPGGKKKGPSYV